MIRKTLKRVLPSFLRPAITAVLERVIPFRRRRKQRWQRRDRDRDAAKVECRDLAPTLFGSAAQALDGRLDVLTHAIDAAQATPRGLWLEFGVHRGESLAFIAERTDETVFGFDSFLGLPEDWVYGQHERLPAGAFALPAVPDPPPGCSLIEGRFEDALPAFFRTHREPTQFVHIDCDLYSSTRCVLEHLPVQPGTIIVFDEYYNYPFWREGEYRAFQEYLAEQGQSAACIAYARNGFNAAFQIL